jgi:hypothetical protein
MWAGPLSPGRPAASLSCARKRGVPNGRPRRPGSAVTSEGAGLDGEQRRKLRNQMTGACKAGTTDRADLSGLERLKGGCFSRDRAGDGRRSRPPQPLRVGRDDIRLCDDQIVDRHVDGFHAPSSKTERAGVRQKLGAVRPEQDDPREQQRLMRGKPRAKLLRNVSKVGQRVLLGSSGDNDEIPLIGKVCRFQQTKEENPAAFSRDFRLHCSHLLEEITHRINP